LGVIENLSITGEQDAPAPVSMRVRLPKGAASPCATAERKGGMSFPWEPRSLERASAACVSYDVLLPAEFDFSRGGRLPGLFGSNGVGQDSFAARMPGVRAAAARVAVRTLSAGDMRQSTLGLDEFAFPRGPLVQDRAGSGAQTRPNKPTVSSPFGSTARWLASAAIWCFAPMRRWR
jgi:hypothetical protein